MLTKEFITCTVNGFISDVLVITNEATITVYGHPTIRLNPEQAEKLSSTLRHAAFLTAPITPKGE